MLNKLAWLAGYTGRKTADYLTGTDHVRGKLNEAKLAYKAGTYGMKAPKIAPNTEDLEDEVLNWAAERNWEFDS